MSVLRRPFGYIASLAGRIPGRFQFMAFLITCVIVAIIMTIVSYNLYVISGAASLDLSRPGYKQALTEVNTSTSTDDYSISANGPLSKDVLNQFKSELTKQTSRMKTSSAYSGEALNDDSLNLFNNVAGSQ